MKTYPSIDWKPRTLQSAYVFAKLDGSNIRAEWSAKKGFYKFGRRNGLLDDSNPVLKESPDIIMRDWAVPLNTIFRQMRLQKAIAFFEFWGDNSFAGAHEDEEHRCTLIDVSCHPKGIMLPKDFCKTFEGLPHAPLLHHGVFDAAMEEQIRSGTLPNMPFEGVIVKGGYISPGLPLMFKVKTGAWFEKLRSLYPTHEDLTKAT